MMVYKQLQYAAKVLLMIAKYSDKPMNVLKLQSSLGVSKLCLKKIFSVLNEAKFIQSSNDEIHSLIKPVKDIRFNDINSMFKLAINRNCG